MKIFCDTNIIMEYIQQRRYSKQVEQALGYAEANDCILYISFGSFYTITYLVERYLKEEHLEKGARLEKHRTILNGVLDLFQFSVPSTKAMADGVNDEHFSDLEDSYQAHAALEQGCDMILTIDIKHYGHLNGKSSITVIDPITFVERFCQGR